MWIEYKPGRLNEAFLDALWESIKELNQDLFCDWPTPLQENLRHYIGRDVDAGANHTNNVAKRGESRNIPEGP